MDELTAFERQIASELGQMAGPGRRIDAMAMVRMVATTSSRWSPVTRLRGRISLTPTDGGFTMFSALKLIAAAAIVALFGGFLLAGGLTRPQGEEMAPAAVTESPSPMTTEDLLSGMVTEEVEPGVMRVVNDGYRDVSYREDFCYPWDCGVVIVGDNGHVWRTGGGRLYRLGQDGEWDEDEWGDGTELPGLDLQLRYSVMADHDGRLWAMSDAGPRVFEDGAWVPGVPGVETNLDPFSVQADGTVWLFGQDLCWTGETSTGCTSWPDVYDGGEYETGQPVVLDDGVVWLLARHEEDEPISVLRFDGTEWQVIPAPESVSGDNVVGGSMAPASDVAPDGTLWTVGDSLPQHQSLARLDETGWTIFGDADGVKTWGGQEAWWGSTMDMLRVTPDGSAWVNATVPGTRACDGLARFDGDSWQPFLSGQCISDYDLAPDGSVWVVTHDPDGGEVDTYVITPEAVAGKE